MLGQVEDEYVEDLAVFAVSPSFEDPDVVQGQGPRDVAEEPGPVGGDNGQVVGAGYDLQAAGDQQASLLLGGKGWPRRHRPALQDRPRAQDEVVDELRFPR